DDRRARARRPRRPPATDLPTSPGGRRLRRRRLGRRFDREVARQMLREQRSHRIGWLRALTHPVLHPLLVELDAGRLGARVVRAYVLDEAGVARRPRFHYYYAEEGFLRRPHPPQTNREHLSSYEEEGASRE